MIKAAAQEGRLLCKRIIPLFGYGFFEAERYQLAAVPSPDAHTGA